MNNQIQNNEFILKGDLGEANVYGNIVSISNVWRSKDGLVTLTLNPLLLSDALLEASTQTEEIEYEIISTKLPVEIEKI